MKSKIENRKSKIENVLVVKLADLGDVLTATPALRALRESFPNAKIDLLLTHHTQNVLRYSTLVDTLIPSDNFRFLSLKAALKPHLLKEGLSTLKAIRQKKYDAVIILHHLSTRAGALKYAAIAKASRAGIVVGLAPPGKRASFLTHAITDEGFGAKHEIDYWLDAVALLGAKTANREMEMPVSAKDRDWAKEILEGEGPTVVIHPGSGGYSAARRWNPAHFAAVADELAQDGARIFLVGQAGDGTETVKAAMKAGALDLTGQTSLHQLAALLSEASLFIGGDSGVTHIASAAGKPLIAIFGPTNASAWGPVGSKRIVLQANVPCGPCAYVGHGVGLREGCEAVTCLKLISPQDVLSAARGLLESESFPFQRGGDNFDGERKILPSLVPSLKGREGLKAATILGVQVQAVTFEQTQEILAQFIAEGGPHQVATVNPEFVVAAQGDAVFRRILNRAALAFPDGTGILKAAGWLKQTPLPERIPGVDTVEALMAQAAKKGYRVYFLGAGPGVAQKAANILQKRYPGLVIAGCYAGSPRAEEEDEIIARIQQAHPDILLVAYGAPKQDKWIARNMYRLPASVLIGVGGTFDFISGEMKRAPLWMQRLNIEWLYRLIQQPSRWKRIWNAVPRFTWLVWRERLRGSK